MTQSEPLCLCFHLQSQGCVWTRFIFFLFSAHKERTTSTLLGNIHWIWQKVWSVIKQNSSHWHIITRSRLDLLNPIFFFKDNFLVHFWAFIYRGQLKMWKGRERCGMTCSKGPQVRVKPTAAASRSKPLHMGACSLPVELPRRQNPRGFINSTTVPLQLSKLNLYCHLTFALQNMSPRMQLTGLIQKCCFNL